MVSQRKMTKFVLLQNSEGCSGIKKDQLTFAPHSQTLHLYKWRSIIYPSEIVSVSIDALESDLVVEEQPEVV